MSERVPIPLPQPFGPIWNAWTHNYIPKEDGYRTHVFAEGDCRNKGRTRTLCGVKIQETGMIELHEDGWKPGCMKCRRALLKRGLIETEQRHLP